MTSQTALSRAGIEPDLLLRSKNQHRGLTSRTHAVRTTNMKSPNNSTARLDLLPHRTLQERPSKRQQLWIQWLLNYDGEIHEKVLRQETKHHHAASSENESRAGRAPQRRMNRVEQVYGDSNWESSKRKLGQRVRSRILVAVLVELQTRSKGARTRQEKAEQAPRTDRGMDLLREGRLRARNQS
jgi:hypothetical protein